MAGALKILIVDEDPDRRINTRKAAQRVQLGIAGEVGYGTKAVSLALDIRPDIFLVAVEEPVGRPLETAEALANVLPSTPIIISSSIDDAQSIRRAMLMGARDYIVQPVQAEQLLETINTVLAQEERRQMRRAGQLSAYQRRGTVITVTGGKGGIGKTVVSVNLSLGLRRETGMSVVIVDADIQFGDVATMLDLTPTRAIDALIPKLDQLDRQNIFDFLTDHESGVAVLAAASEGGEIWAELNPEGMKRIIDLLAQNFEFVIIDTAPSFDQTVRACIESSTLALIVTSGEVSCIRDTATVLRRLKAWGVPPDRFEVLFNHTGHRNGVQLEDLKQAVDREIFWQVPYDRHVPVSVNLGQPVTYYNDSSDAARNLLSLSRLIAGTNKPLVQPQRKSLFKNLRKTAKSSS
jgi:pilus assembly protein CpaE